MNRNRNRKLLRWINRKYDYFVKTYPSLAPITLSFMLPAFMIWCVFYFLKYIKVKIDYIPFSWDVIFTISTLITMLGMSIHGVLIISGVVA